MVIKKDIEAGHVLWVRKVPGMEGHRTARRNADGSWVHIPSQPYEYLALTTRRGRTQGATVEKELYPFLKALGIKLIERQYYDGRIKYVAVGTVWRSRTILEGQELNIAVSPIVNFYYRKLKNIDIKPLLDKRSAPISPEIILEMRHALAEPVGDIWPEREPSFPVRNMSISSHVQNVRW